MRVTLPVVSIAILAVWLIGCSSGSGFDSDAFGGILQSAPLSLSSEQVTLTQGQVDCGVQSELWEAPSGVTAKLLQKGRNLKFTDDVRVSDPDITVPYTQVTGSFRVQVADVSRIRDTDGGKKLADVKLGIIINDSCFNAPLPLMGVRKGKFSPDAPVVFQFQGSGKEWSLDRLVH
jgi:hypothetical protein